ncbi:diguanylate cyclase/phosphodiesterase (GGDEF & EAL domains) with PAS/PAC sensor(s), partial [hydrothermal vent metagenome]
MNIAARILLIFSIVLGLLVAIVISMSFLADSRQKTADAERQLYNFYKLANQLRQSSDDFTRMARTYVMTGDKAYQEYYFQILGIRDGVLPRPRHYEGSYWDYITTKEKNEEAYDPPMSLFDQMRQAGVTEQELAILMQSKEQSDALSKMEQRAFGAMAGFFPDDDGKLTVQKAPDPDYARKLLHSDPYHRYKAGVMHPITSFNNLIQERVLNEVEENKKTEKLLWKLTAILTVVSIIFAVITFLFFKYRVLKPIVSLSNTAHKILSGDLDSRAMTKYQDEIGELYNAFNTMIDARLKTELELEISEKSLRTTLNAIGDAMISTDIYGHITRMNPVAEKMTGWKLIDALGKPLSEVCNIINTKTGKPAVNPVQKVIDTGQICALAKDTTLISKEGTEYQIADSAAPIWNETGDITGVVLVFQDVTNEYAVLERLHKSEEKFKRLFENSEVSICNEDLSEIKIELERLRDEGVTDIRQYLKENSQLLWELVNKVKVIQVNEATLKLFGATSDSSFIRQFDRTFGPNAIDVFTDGLCAIWDKKTMYRAISEFRTLDGTLIKAIISYPIPDNLEAFKSIPLSIIDITELIKSEERFRSLFENAVVSIWNEDLSEIYQTMQNLRQDGIHDLRQYLYDNEQAPWDMAAMVKVRQVNNATLKLFNAKSSEEFIPQIDKTFGPSAIHVFIDELCAIWDKKK